MKENMLDVLLYLFEHYMEEGRDISHDEDILKAMLKKAGFAQTEINKAFVWLDDLLNQPGTDRAPESRAGAVPPAAPGRSSFRVYTPLEQTRLDLRCRGFLALLEQMQVIDPATRELIIERALAVDLDELDIERFKWIVMMVLANHPGIDGSQGSIEILLGDHSAGIIH